MTRRDEMTSGRCGNFTQGCTEAVSLELQEELSTLLKLHVPSMHAGLHVSRRYQPVNDCRDAGFAALRISGSRLLVAYSEEIQRSSLRERDPGPQCPAATHSQEHVNEDGPHHASSTDSGLMIQQADSHALHAGNNSTHIPVRNSFTGTLMGA